MSRPFRPDASPLCNRLLQPAWRSLARGTSLRCILLVGIIVPASIDCELRVHLHHTAETTSWQGPIYHRGTSSLNGKCSSATDCVKMRISSGTRWRARLRRAPPSGEWRGGLPAPETASPSGDRHGARRPRPLLCLDRRPDGPRKTKYGEHAVSKNTRGSSGDHPGSTESRPPVGGIIPAPCGKDMP